ncbi:MAG TPA: imidazolonepropionase [Phycisphaerales bacterium]|nr:imidazolonepropionase [Phycisphaerales bacterium]
MSLAIINARILTLDSFGRPEPRRKKAMRDLGVIQRGWIRCENGRIAAVQAGDYPGPYEGQVIDASGNVLLPAFVDCHTHACWAGDRFDEFEMSLQGAPYLEILRRGGGIMSTVGAVRAATEDELASNLLRRLGGMAALGTGTVEVKSGYGLNTDDELKMLRAIHQASRMTMQTVTGTFLGAHAIDPGNPRTVEQIIDETLPAVASEFPGITCDAFCEEGAWSLDDCRRLFEYAKELGCPIRVHTDQFNSLGMTRLAVEFGAVSVDHLEAITPKDLEHLAHSRTIAVCLPCAGFHLDGRYAPARALIDVGGAVAIATNCNPGSAPTPSMAFTIALACRKLRLTPAEAITAATFNAACVLGMQETIGSIAVGKRADFQLIDATDEREIGFEIAGPGPLAVVLGGEIVHLRSVGRDEEEEADGESTDEGEGGESN